MHQCSYIRESFQQATCLECTESTFRNSFIHHPAGGGGGEGCHPDGEPAQVPGLRPRHQDHPDRRVTRQGSQGDQAQQGLSLKAHPPVPVLVPCWSMCKDL